MVSSVFWSGYKFVNFLWSVFYPVRLSFLPALLLLLFFFWFLFLFFFLFLLFKELCGLFKHQNRTSVLIVVLILLCLLFLIFLLLLLLLLHHFLLPLLSFYFLPSVVHYLLCSLSVMIYMPRVCYRFGITRHQALHSRKYTLTLRC